MRSLTKDPQIHNAAQIIVQFFTSKFTQEEIHMEKEIEKLKKEKAILSMQKEELVKCQSQNKHM